MGIPYVRVLLLFLYLILFENFTQGYVYYFTPYLNPAYPPVFNNALTGLAFPMQVNVNNNNNNNNNNAKCYKFKVLDINFNDNDNDWLNYVFNAKVGQSDGHSDNGQRDRLDK